LLDDPDEELDPEVVEVDPVPDDVVEEVDPVPDEVVEEELDPEPDEELLLDEPDEELDPEVVEVDPEFDPEPDEELLLDDPDEELDPEVVEVDPVLDDVVEEDATCGGKQIVVKTKLAIDWLHDFTSLTQKLGKGSSTKVIAVATSPGQANVAMTK